NYFGFPTGISGGALTKRGLAQAEKFGARIAIASSAHNIRFEGDTIAIELSGGRAVRARALILATGAEYRKLEVPDRQRFEGVGIYYAATYLEAQLCSDEEIVVVGGGNSAGQAANFLAGGCRQVPVLARSAAL